MSDTKSLGPILPDDTPVSPGIGEYVPAIVLRQQLEASERVAKANAKALAELQAHHAELKERWVNAYKA